MHRRTSGLNAVKLVWLFGFVALTGCSSYQPPAVTTATVTAVAPLATLEDQVALDFTLTSKDAVGAALVDTTSIRRQALNSLSAAARADLRAGVVPDISPTDPAAAAAPALGAATFPAFAESGLKTDPFLAYTTAAALKQEVAMLNATIRQAAVGRDYVPYLVRLQVNQQPIRQSPGFDTFLDVSFMLENEEHADSPDEKKASTPEVDARGDGEAGGASNGSGTSSGGKPNESNPAPQDAPLEPAPNAGGAAGAQQEEPTTGPQPLPTPAEAEAQAQAKAEAKTEAESEAEAQTGTGADAQPADTTDPRFEMLRPLAVKAENLEQFRIQAQSQQLLDQTLDTQSIKTMYTALIAAESARQDAVAAESARAQAEKDARDAREAAEKARANVRRTLAADLRVIPLLSTDQFEGLQLEQSVQTLRALNLALGATIGGSDALAGRIDAIDEKLKQVQTRELNTLLTVGRISDNTLRVRLGARLAPQDDDAKGDFWQAARFWERNGRFNDPNGYRTLPRTHHINLVLLVPRVIAVDETGEPVDKLDDLNVRAFTRSEYRNATRGLAMSPQPRHWLDDWQPMRLDNYERLYEDTLRSAIRNALKRNRLAPEAWRKPFTLFRQSDEFKQLVDEAYASIHRDDPKGSYPLLLCRVQQAVDAANQVEAKDKTRECDICGTKVGNSDYHTITALILQDLQGIGANRLQRSTAFSLPQIPKYATDGDCNKKALLRDNGKTAIVTYTDDAFAVTSARLDAFVQIKTDAGPRVQIPATRVDRTGRTVTVTLPSLKTLKLVGKPIIDPKTPGDLKLYVAPLDASTAKARCIRLSYALADAPKDPGPPVTIQTPGSIRVARGANPAAPTFDLTVVPNPKFKPTVKAGATVWLRVNAANAGGFTVHGIPFNETDAAGTAIDMPASNFPGFPKVYRLVVGRQYHLSFSPNLAVDQTPEIELTVFRNDPNGSAILDDDKPTEPKKPLHTRKVKVQE
ncbi:MAG: hypothetical protein AAGF84_05385 [Planctomycetota bacterium]